MDSFLEPLLLQKDPAFLHKILLILKSLDSIDIREKRCQGIIMSLKLSDTNAADFFLKP